MKKIFSLILILSLFSSLFANSIKASYLHSSNYGRSVVIENLQDKKITIVRVSPKNGSLSQGVLTKTIKELENGLCDNSKIRKKIVDGYEFNIIYIFGNGLIIQSIINSCPL